MYPAAAAVLLACPAGIVVLASQPLFEPYRPTASVVFSSAPGRSARLAVAGFRGEPSCLGAYGAALVLSPKGCCPSVHLGLTQAIGVFTCSYLVGFVALFAPGGLGPRESVFLLMLAGDIGLKPAAGLSPCQPAPANRHRGASNHPISSPPERRQRFTRSRGLSGTTASSELDSLPRWAPFVVMAVLTLLAFRQYLLSGPGEMLLGQDTIAAGIMFRKFFVEHIRALGRLPLWNPYLFGGVPTVEAGSGDILYPTSILHFLLPLTSALAWKLILHVYLAGVFMYLAARALGQPSVRRLLRRLSLPAVGQSREPGLGRTGRKDVRHRAFSRRRSGCWSPRWTGGPGSASSGSVSWPDSWWWPTPSWRTTPTSPWRDTRWAVCGCAGGKGRVPRQRSCRRHAGGGHGGWAWPLWCCCRCTAISGKIHPAPDRAVASSTQPAGRCTPRRRSRLFIPEFSGTDVQSETYWGKNPFKHNSEYGGALVFVLGIAAVAGLKGDRRRWGLGAMAAIALLYALGAGTPMFRVLYYVVPGLKNFRAPSLADIRSHRRAHPPGRTVARASARRGTTRGPAESHAHRASRWRGGWRC